VFCEQHHVPSFASVDVGVNARCLMSIQLLGWIARSRFVLKISQEAAMSAEQVAQSIQSWCRRKQISLLNNGVKFEMFGEMGIGNTCVSLA